MNSPKIRVCNIKCCFLNPIWKGQAKRLTLNRIIHLYCFSSWNEYLIHKFSIFRLKSCTCLCSLNTKNKRHLQNISTLSKLRFPELFIHPLLLTIVAASSNDRLVLSNAFGKMVKKWKMRYHWAKIGKLFSFFHFLLNRCLIV